MRTFVAIALLALPAAAGAERPIIAEAAAVDRTIDDAALTRARELFASTLRETGVDVMTAGQRRMSEFVASLTLEQAEEGLVLTAQISRFHLDRWSARAQTRVTSTETAALEAAVQDLAQQIALAVRTAPARDESRPDERPPARKVQRQAPQVAEPTP